MAQNEKREQMLEIAASTADDLMREIHTQLEDWESGHVVLNERTRRLLNRTRLALGMSGAVVVRRFGVIAYTGTGEMREALRHPAAVPPNTARCVAWAYMEIRKAIPLPSDQPNAPTTEDAVRTYDVRIIGPNSDVPAWGIVGDMTVLVVDLDDENVLRWWGKSANHHVLPAYLAV